MTHWLVMIGVGLATIAVVNRTPIRQYIAPNP